ncbi:hypothetical protein ACQ86G_08470 [Roseateles chitinivorans]|uniref:hypothetical protein n=1 Tax=Roseateles chitinivorans TaxID=2917965 RepID=UPI003D67D76E
MVAQPLQVHINFLKDVLPLIPVDAALGAAATRELFLDWCEGLGYWTVRRACPLDGEHGSQDLAVEKPEVSDFEWSLALYTLLARVSLDVSPQEAERRFVAPACAADDATFAHLLETFSSMLSCAIADQTRVPAGAIPLLQAVGQRLLQCGHWSDGVGYRSGSTEADPGRIVESLFFRFPRKANLASRFANGDWRDVGLTLPIFEPVLRARGVDVRVARAWLSLCEDALDYYPPTHFIEHLKHVFPAQDGRPEWNDTPLVAKLAGLIQRFSERSIPLLPTHASELLKALDVLVDLGDRRAAAVQMSEIFRSTRRAESAADAA